MKKIFSFLKPYKLPIAVALSLMLVELSVELIQPILMAKIIDDGISQKDLSTVYLWSGVLVGLSVLAFICGIANSFVSSHVSQGFGYDVRKGLFEKVQSFSFTNLDKIPTSSLITRMTNDVSALQNTVFMGLRIMLRAPLLVIGGTIMALLVNFRLSFILLVSIPIIIFFLIWIMNRAGKLFKSVQEKLDHVNGVMRENLTGMRLIKAFLRKEYEINRFENASEQLKKKMVASFRLIETTMPILLLVMNLSIIIILWFGREQIAAGDMNVGELVAIINYATRITASFSMFSWLIMALSRARASSQRINEVFDTEVDLLDSIDVEASAEIRTGKVEFKSVSFRYPTTEVPVLRDISFTAGSGDTVAIMGATGSGKTSLFQLIPRLYDPDDGEVLVDGRNVKQIQLDSLRKQIGVVPQEAHLFTGTVHENISWGKASASDEAIIEAAINAQIHETIMKLPMQYDTMLGQKGVNLSGGQKQRLSIARALVREPRILLLDDSTSALDLKTEARLLHALKKYSCTTLIITQKISTARKADLILLIEDGSLIAKGTHEQMLKGNALYQKIYQSQFGEEAL
ncbi:ABC transporter ATP-binding protein [Bacillus sp. V59.32b]|uniref:ABC transporter ATP-binding protein n=1 Tax=Bacillus sp. V59.32b TaxID=1758642 RepID=UPI000E3B7049|nr:ABC transporter ATP-binding protein [Bacillus sp. V59.32b]RFU69502.1 ABC transporter ATP-binding protein [Bacillus sp. V59.32b]